jgi:hypothetical protein
MHNSCIKIGTSGHLHRPLAFREAINTFCDELVDLFLRIRNRQLFELVKELINILLCIGLLHGFSIKLSGTIEPFLPVPGQCTAFARQTVNILVCT